LPVSWCQKAYASVSETRIDTRIELLIGMETERVPY
jgi:hypothetical protein